ncbi:MAG: hypothetical protein JNL17_04970 [Cyclobacteriaceae bacterium]|nr:hypothetical protein [Cyclobacteriaceae bacterium]
MDKEFFLRKIKALTDDKLIDLLQKTSGESNPDILELAKEEAGKRNLKLELTHKDDKINIESKSNDHRKLRKWNWGAFILAPIWTLANRLEKWTILCFVPILNIVVAFYLGYNGNRLAFGKSKIDSVDDFMVIQKNWGLWGVRLFWLGLLGGLSLLIIDAAKR